MPPAVAIATSPELPHLHADDQHLQKALHARGVDAAPVVWSDAAEPWRGARAVLVRSVWDYYTRAAEFAAWVDAVEAAGVPLWNAAPVVRWNADKRYLRHLEARGVPVVPTAWLAPGAPTDLAATLEKRGWAEAVVKPAVGGGAHLTARVTARNVDAAAPLVRRIHAGGATAMVQPYVPEVATRGEWSLVYVDGAFTHAVLKRPASGDFRVQAEHGGDTEPADAPQGLVDAGRAALDAAGEATGHRGPLLYARVDVVEQGGEARLMELELIEPELFLRFAPGATERLADAVAARLHAL